MTAGDSNATGVRINTGGVRDNKLQEERDNPISRETKIKRIRRLYMGYNLFFVVESTTFSSQIRLSKDHEYPYIIIAINRLRVPIAENPIHAL